MEINPKYMESQKRMSVLSLTLTEICCDSDCTDEEIASVLVNILNRTIQRSLPSMMKAS